MSGFINITCTACDYSGGFWWTPTFLYLLPNDDLLDVALAFVECRSCGGITYGETIPTIEELEALLTIPAVIDATAILTPPERERTAAHLRTFGWTHDLIRRSFLTGGRFSKIPLPKVIREHADERIDFVRQRRSPARCMNCGSKEISHIGVPYDDAPLVHPNCGGSLTVTGSGIGNMPAVYFDVEGDRIEDQSRGQQASRAEMERMLADRQKATPPRIKESRAD